MLREIKQLLKKQSPLSLKELAIHFSVTPETILPMLKLLEEKRQIRSIQTNCGGSCAGCPGACRDEMLLFTLRPESTSSGEP